jgi:hypothetical protein
LANVFLVEPHEKEEPTVPPNRDVVSDYRSFDPEWRGCINTDGYDNMLGDVSFGKTKQKWNLDNNGGNNTQRKARWVQVETVIIRG